MQYSVPCYFDSLIEGFLQGQTGRFVHLGHWDKAPAPDATLRYEDFQQAQHCLNKLLLARGDLDNNQSVLDVGCGFGGTLQAIDNQYKNMRLAGINIDPRQLEICAQLIPSATNTYAWDQADACALPYIDQSFDRIFCIEAMFHFASRRHFFHECARLLKPGGILVASDIIITHSAQDLEGPVADIEAAVTGHYGPWPDFRGKDCDHRKLGNDSGLDCCWLYDATDNTFPSHRFTLPADLDENHDSEDPALRAAMMLRRLHKNRCLKYIYMRFTRPVIAE